MTLIQSFQKLISYKKNIPTSYRHLSTKDHIHTSSSKTAAPAEAFFVWYSAESELWPGTGFHITLPVTTGVQKWRFLAGRSAGRHSRSRSWRSEVTKNHWLFCAPWQEHDKHPIQDCCTKSIMSVSRLLTFCRTPAAV